MISPRSSTSTGATKPNSRMLASICATCSAECVRALPAYGSRDATARASTALADHGAWGICTCVIVEWWPARLATARRWQPGKLAWR
jgi:hypothetical protein